MKRKTSKKRVVKHHRKKEEHDVTYVGVTSPVDIRRSVLSGAIETSYSLRNYNKYASIRKNKMDKMNEVRKILEKVNKEVNKLRRNLPKDKDIEMWEEPVKEEVKNVKTVEHSKIKAEGNKLDTEISEIRRRLDSIGGML